MDEPTLIAIVVGAEETFRAPEVWITVLRGRLFDGDDVQVTHADGRRQVIAFTGVSRRGVTVANGTGLGGVAHAGPFKQRGVREGRYRVGDLLQSPGCLPVESTACQELRDLIVEARSAGRNTANPHIDDDIVALYVHKVLTDAARRCTGPLVGSAAYEHASNVLAGYGLQEDADRARLVAAGVREGAVAAPCIVGLNRLIAGAPDAFMYDTPRLLKTVRNAALQTVMLGRSRRNRIAAQGTAWRKELMAADRAVAVGWCARCDDFMLLTDRFACRRCGRDSVRYAVVVPADINAAEDEMRGFTPPVGTTRRRR